MNKINCIIVEDEPLAAEVLKDYVEMVPQLELKAICPDAMYAMEELRKHPIDLMFLDIHLPKLKGLDLIKSLKDPPHIILTTAYHQYAIEAFDLSVVDYLLKPIAFQRFLKAINKLPAPEVHKKHDDATLVEQITDRSYQYFNVNKKRVKVYIDEILFIESLKEYVKIHTHEREVITKFQLGEMLDLLASENFLRIHRSYLVAIDKIRAYSSQEVEIAGKSLPIGRSYKELVLKALEI